MCTWRLQSSTKAINDSEDKTLSRPWVFFLIIKWFYSFLAVTTKIWMHFLLSFHIFLLVLTKENACIEGIVVFLPFPSLPFNRFFSDSITPTLLTMLLLDIVTDEKAKSESLALGLRLWVVCCRGLEYIIQKDFHLSKTFFLTFEPLT